MNTPSTKQIVNDISLWWTYVDPQKWTTVEEFESLTESEKVTTMRQCGIDVDASMAAATLGRLGGLAKSDKKTAAVRENGKKGGRPVMPEHSTVTVTATFEAGSGTRHTDTVSLDRWAEGSKIWWRPTDSELWRHSRRDALEAAVGSTLVSVSRQK